MKRPFGVEGFKRRVRTRIEAEIAAANLEWWWLSFADGGRPKEEQFLGGIWVKAYGFASAHAIVNLLGCNPGGEVLGAPAADFIDIPEEWAKRLLTRAECEELDEKVLKVQKARWQAREAAGRA